MLDAISSERLDGLPQNPHASSLSERTDEQGNVVFEHTDEIKQEMIGRYFDRLKWGEYPHDSPHSQMAPNMCANRGWAASIWVNRLMSGSRRKSVMFGMSS